MARDTTASDRWERIKWLFHAALRQSPERRDAFLTSECGADVGLADEIRALLAHHIREGDSAAGPEHGAVEGDEPELAWRAALGRLTDTTSVSDFAFDHGRFLPGTLIVGRYRVVARLGRGGMGEVYRADDLKLGQTVALKFLPATPATDPQQLVRLRSEVRLARQVSHPGVCRVHDIGDADGQPFLSMQYINGEDLATLLRRFGRIPHERGVELARQLCAALTAAHAQGVLHRDLKPSNVMIDSRGRAVITDFGIAELMDEVRREVTAGTPAYMAPEQLAGEQASARSDIYSLGLVLYEMFTGEQAFRGASMSEVRHYRENHPTARPLGELVVDIDPGLERAILRCLEEDPATRPASVLQVLSMLPGGDPLAAALAAGETPSPEMVAAAAAPAGMSLRSGVACLAACILALVAAIALSRDSQMINLIQIKKPVRLEERGEQIVRELGYSQPRGYVASGFHFDFPFIEYVVEAGGHWNRVSDPGPSPVFYWYRRSCKPMVASRSFDFNTYYWRNGPGAVTMNDPPMRQSGMILLKLDPREGRLTEFQSIPWEDPARAADGHVGNSQIQPTTRRSVWEKLFDCADLDADQWDEVEPRWTPPVHSDIRRAWVSKGAKPLWPQWPQIATRVEAATLDDKIVWFRLIGEAKRSDGSLRAITESRDDTDLLVPAHHGAWRIDNALRAVAFLVAAVLAIWNLRLGRGDRRGAMRLAQLAFATSLLAWALQASHVANLAEWPMAQMGVAWALLMAGQLWVCYIGTEPYVRRFWPQTMISWSRLLAGRWRDPLVGRDVLVGLLAGVVVFIFSELDALAPLLYGDSMEAKWRWARLHVLEGLRHWFAELLLAQWWAFEVGLLYILLLFLVLRLILRNIYLAAVVFVVYHATVFALNVGNHHVIVFISTALQATLGLFILMRFGLLSSMALWFAYALLCFPINSDLSCWYAGSGLIAAAVVAALAVGCLHVALGGRRGLALNPASI